MCDGCTWRRSVRSVGGWFRQMRAPLTPGNTLAGQRPSSLLPHRLAQIVANRSSPLRIAASSSVD